MSSDFNRIGLDRLLDTPSQPWGSKLVGKGVGLGHESHSAMRVPGERFLSESVEPQV